MLLFSANRKRLDQRQTDDGTGKIGTGYYSGPFPMASYRVTCKEKHSIYERIVAVGCVNEATGSTQRFLEDDAINRIEKHIDTFYDEDAKGHRVPVEVREREGRKFLITKRDGFKEDNLLYLPDCPNKN